MLRYSGTALRTLRKERHISATQLAYQIGVTEGYIGHIERGLYAPRIPMLEKLCHVLDCEPCALFVDDGINNDG